MFIVEQVLPTLQQIDLHNHNEPFIISIVSVKTMLQMRIDAKNYTKCGVSVILQPFLKTSKFNILPKILTLNEMNSTFLFLLSFSTTSLYDI